MQQLKQTLRDLMAIDSTTGFFVEMDEYLLAPLAPLRKIFRLGPFHGKIHIPAAVMHFPDTAHTAPDGL